jgi:hypothetical protein
MISCEAQWFDRRKARDYHSIHAPGSYAKLKALDFSPRQCRLAPGLLVPSLDLDGQPVLYQFRPATPQLAKDGNGAAAQSHRRCLAVFIYHQRYVPPLECGHSVPAL